MGARTNLAEPPMSIEAFQSAVTPILAEMEASANAHDTDRHMAAYARSPSLVFVFNGEVVPGWDALRQQQLKWWDGGKAKGSYAYVGTPLFESIGDDAGITTFLIAARREMEDGTVVERTLAHSALWRRLAEGWRIIYAHESSTK
jgi:ketosteroid isomerase-like protein